MMIWWTIVVLFTLAQMIVYIDYHLDHLCSLLELCYTGAVYINATIWFSVVLYRGILL